jgi:hypothetical protein
LRQGRAETSNLIAQQRRDHFTQFRHHPAAAPLLESDAAAGSQIVRKNFLPLRGEIAVVDAEVVFVVQPEGAVVEAGRADC